jgi:uncharacterized damage-inducible protein DinB
MPSVSSSLLLSEEYADGHNMPSRMNTREFFIRQFQSERPKFLNVFRAMPAGQLGYRSHERNSTAARIAWTIVQELRALVDLVETGENRWEHREPPDSPEAIAAEYEKAAAALEKALASTDESAWNREGRMLLGEKVMMQRPVGEIVWDFFFDAIHHRGQLTTYLRPMGGKVPSIYGPSGDAK